MGRNLSVPNSYPAGRVQESQSTGKSSAVQVSYLHDSTCFRVGGS